MAGKDVTNKESAEIALPGIRRMTQIMLMEATDVSGPEKAAQIAQTVSEKVMNATTADDVFDAAESGLETAETMLGKPTLVTNIEFAKSGVADSALPVYTIVTCVDDDGVEHIYSVGGPTAQTQLFKLRELGEIPGIVMVLIEKASAGNPDRSVHKYRRATSGEQKLFS